MINSKATKLQSWIEMNKNIHTASHRRKIYCHRAWSENCVSFLYVVVRSMNFKKLTCSSCLLLTSKSSVKISPADTRIFSNCELLQKRVIKCSSNAQHHNGWIHDWATAVWWRQKRCWTLAIISYIKLVTTNVSKPLFQSFLSDVMSNGSFRSFHSAIHRAHTVHW